MSEKDKVYLDKEIVQRILQGFLRGLVEQKIDSNIRNMMSEDSICGYIDKIRKTLDGDDQTIFRESSTESFGKWIPYLG